MQKNCDLIGWRQAGLVRTIPPNLHKQKWGQKCVIHLYFCAMYPCLPEVDRLGHRRTPNPSASNLNLLRSSPVSSYGVFHPENRCRTNGGWWGKRDVKLNTGYTGAVHSRSNVGQALQNRLVFSFVHLVTIWVCYTAVCVCICELAILHVVASICM